MAAIIGADGAVLGELAAKAVGEMCGAAVSVGIVGIVRVGDGMGDGEP